jgi:hypothetical protein
LFFALCQQEVELVRFLLTPSRHLSDRGFSTPKAGLKRRREKIPASEIRYSETRHRCSCAGSKASTPKACVLAQTARIVRAEMAPSDNVAVASDEIFAAIGGIEPLWLIEEHVEDSICQVVFRSNRKFAWRYRALRSPRTHPIDLVGTNVECIQLGVVCSRPPGRFLSGSPNARFHARVGYLLTAVGNVAPQDVPCYVCQIGPSSRLNKMICTNGTALGHRSLNWCNKDF